jgi:3-hydroxyacyl-[acyl-carrier-protein] dehydratase
LKKKLDSFELLDYQPNRYPFLMIDGVTKLKPGFYAEGFKNFTNNEWFFPIHFKNNPNVPGALQLEAMAQMLTVAITSLPGLKGKVTHALQHTVRFKQEIKPGDTLKIITKVLSWKRGICDGIAKGYVKNKMVCEAEMKITIPEILEKFIPKKKSIKKSVKK